MATSDSVYPFAAQVGSQAGRIQKLNLRGFMCETQKPLNVGDEFQVNFSLPIMGNRVMAPCIVVKTYDYILSDKKINQGKTSLLSEIHFKSITSDVQKVLSEFLKRYK